MTELPSQQPPTEAEKITSFVRTKGAELGLDVPRLVRGQVIDSILGDDPNTFSGAEGILELGMDDEFKLVAEPARTDLVDILDWESSIPEIDKPLLDRLTEVRSQIGNSNWADPEAFKKDTALWKEKVFDWLQKQAEENPNILEDKNYFHDTWFADSPLKQAYLKTKQ